MELGPLHEGALLGRRKRFFVDVALPSANVVAHCANTGSMRSLLLPGTNALLSYVAGPSRKLDWSLKLLRLPDGTLACVDTGLSNKIVAEALGAGQIPGISAAAVVQPEAVAGPGTRLDFRIDQPHAPICWIEVKNVTLCEEGNTGVVSFPDAVSVRALKHLHTLQALVAQGQRGIILYLANRTDASSFMPAANIDPAYAQALHTVMRQGVEVLVCYTNIHAQGDTWSVSVSHCETWEPS